MDLGNYVQVNDRLLMALEKHPDLRIRELDAELVEMPDGHVLICRIEVGRDAQDEWPVIASASEPYPGRTPYTRGSERMVGMTSALGRALGYMGIGLTSSIASRNEVEAAQSRQSSTHLAPVVPLHEVEVPFPDAPVQEYASPKQLGMMRALANGQGLKGDDLKTFISATLGREVQTTGELTKRDASRVIDALKQSEPK